MKESLKEKLNNNISCSDFFYYQILDIFTLIRLRRYSLL